jgi:pyroglutamyl-peptidase
VSVTFLVTGFEPFAEFSANSSWDAICSLRERWPADIATLRLPVDHRAAHDELRRALVEQQPRVVLCTGLARTGFRIERRARRPSALIDEAGADELHGAWPWAEMAAELERVGVDASDSWDAGQYVCESTYWSLLSFRENTGFPEFAGFLHVPPRSEAFPIERIARAVNAVIAARWRELHGGAQSFEQD